MTEEINSFSSGDDIDTGISTVSTDDWIKLTAFFNSAIHDNPTTEARMRLKLGIQAADTFETDFVETTALFARLQDLGNDFQHDVVEEVLSLSDDIVHYQTTVASVYPRLINLIDRFDWGDDDQATTQEKLDAMVQLWKAGRIDGHSEKIKVRLSRALENLIKEANARAVRAETLQQLINNVDDGMIKRLKNIKSDFDDKKTAYDHKYGDGSLEVIHLKAEVDKIVAKLEALRTKEKREVIVLSSSPAYLVIPLFGPFILAGVDIGVGIDLANTRAEISSCVDKAKLLNDSLDTKERFQTYYTNAMNAVTDMVDRCENIAPRLERVGLGWRAIAKDLDSIVTTLSDSGRNFIKDEDWFNFTSTLKTAQNTWENVGKRADHFRTIAQPMPSQDADSLMKDAGLDEAA